MQKIRLDIPVKNIYGNVMKYEARKASPDAKTDDDVEKYERDFLIGDIIIFSVKTQEPKSMTGNTKYLTPDETAERCKIIEKTVVPGTADPKEEVEYTEEEINVILESIAKHSSIVEGGQAIYKIKEQIND